MGKKQKPWYFRTTHPSTNSKAFKPLSEPAKLLYFWLCKLRSVPGNDVSFWHTDEQFHNELGWGRTKLWEARKELVEAFFIHCCKGKNGYVYTVLDEIYGKAKPKVGSDDSWCEF